MSYQAPPPGGYGPPPGGFGPPPGGFGQPMYGGVPAGNNSKATTSLILGIVSLLCCQLAGIAAVIVGRRAKNEIRSSGQQGDGLATAGIILGWISIALTVLSILLIIALAVTGNLVAETGTS